MGSGRDDIGVLAGIGVQTGGDQSGEMRHIDQEDRAGRVGDLAEAREVEDSRIGAAAGDDQLGLVLLGQTRQLVVIDPLVLFPHSVGDNLVCLSGEIQRVAMCGVPAVRQVHAKNRVARVDDTGIRSLVGLGARVRLHVGVLGVEQLFGAVAGQVLDYIGVLTTAVVAFARV